MRGLHNRHKDCVVARTQLGVMGAGVYVKGKMDVNLGGVRFDEVMR